MEIDRASIHQMRDELQSLLNGWATKNNVSLDVGGASFMPGQNVTFKVQIANKSGDTVLNVKAVAWPLIAPSHGFAATDLNRVFTFLGRKYTITGWNSRSWKSPINATRDDGRTFKFTTEVVKRALGIA